MAGEKENKRSESGSDNKKGHQAGSGHVHDIEHVGSSGGHGVRFKMPKEVPDHSCVRKLGE